MRMPPAVRLLTAAMLLAASTAAAQMPSEQVARELASADRDVRLRATRLLKEAAYLEAAVPLAPLVTDAEDAIQLEAIAAELNIFLAERIVPRRRVGLLIEVRNKIAAEAAFSAGPPALGAHPVPAEVLTALRAAGRDENPLVAAEALYAFGVLSVDAAGSARRDLLRVSAPELAATLGVPDAVLRRAGVRVIGGLFARRPHDDPVDEVVGDAVIVALNDREDAIRTAAMEAIGAMRYERAVQSLTDLFTHYRRGAIREGALDALARIGHAASAPLFTAQLAGRSAGLKVLAIEGLGRVGDRAHEPAIQTALAGERNEAVALAGRFASVLLTSAGIDAVAEALLRPRLREQAQMYLAELAPGRAAALSRYAQDPDPRLRAGVAEALALSGDREALAIVEAMVGDADEEVARAAERAAARLKAATREVS